MSRLLDHLGGEPRAQAERALAGCRVVGVAAGRAAELPEAVLLVVEQGVVVLTGGDQRTVIVAVAGVGAVLLPPGGAEEVRGLTAARVTALDRGAACELMRVPQAAAALTRALLAALEDRRASLTNFARFPHVERVRGKLLQLARAHGRVTARGVVIDLPLTHELLADAIGSSRETVTLALRELGQAGFVDRSGRRYCVRVTPSELS